jgi:hypothetical protein
VFQKLDTLNEMFNFYRELVVFVAADDDNGMSMSEKTATYNFSTSQLSCHRRGRSCIPTSETNSNYNFSQSCIKSGAT